MPFIYGAVIAYLLKPVCNTIEGFLHRIFPEKLHSMANMLAIAATLLFGVLVDVYKRQSAYRPEDG